MSRGADHNKDYFICANCGAQVPADAEFCRACGASSDSGWENDNDWSDLSDAAYDEDEDFDYDDFLRREFPEHAEPDTRPQPWRAVTVAIVLLLCLTFALMSVLGF